MTPKEPNPGYFGTGVVGYQDKQRCFQDSLSPFSLQLLATMDVVAEVWWVGEKVTEEMRRILNKKADDLPAESEEVAKSGSLEQQSDSPAQGDLMAQGCGDDVEG
jgi:hypothetical protein